MPTHSQTLPCGNPAQGLAPSGPIEVVAGVITDARGRILLARRTEGRDLAGFWEFPGGKREPGESADAALARELREELGIEVEVGAPLIAVPQRYPHKRLRLDVRRIAAWRGSLKGHEGQALAWVPPHKLTGYAMPPADIPVVAALLQPDRYLVTPEPGDDHAAWLHTLERALTTSCITRVQLRARHCPADRWSALAHAGARLCQQRGVDVLLNGDPRLAAQLGTGVHLRAAQLRTLTQRPLPRSVSVAASCHDANELQLAQALGCDFAVLGAVNATASHPGVATLGWDGFAALREEVSLPIYAIGGMSALDGEIARQHGAQGIAAIQSLWPATA